MQKVKITNYGPRNVKVTVADQEFSIGEQEEKVLGIEDTLVCVLAGENQVVSPETIEIEDGSPG